MLTQKKMVEIVLELANDRPIFHSEDDFKFALAWLIKKKFPQSDIRLEYPVRSVANNKVKFLGDKYIDLLVTLGESQFPIELKYKTRTFSSIINGEIYQLKNHAAENENRYRFWRDVWRIENFGFNRGFIIFLTNNPRYSKEGDRKDCDDKAFRIHDNRVTKRGTIRWRDPNSKTASKNEFVSPIKLTGGYTLHWRDFSEVNECPKGKFEYLLVEVNK